MSTTNNNKKAMTTMTMMMTMMMMMVTTKMMTTKMMMTKKKKKMMMMMMMMMMTMMMMMMMMIEHLGSFGSLKGEELITTARPDAADIGLYMTGYFKTGFFRRREITTPKICSEMDSALMNSPSFLISHPWILVGLAKLNGKVMKHWPSRFRIQLDLMKDCLMGSLFSR